MLKEAIDFEIAENAKHINLKTFFTNESMTIYVIKIYICTPAYPSYTLFLQKALQELDEDDSAPGVMKLGFALKKTKKSVLQSGGAGAPGANGDGASGAPSAVAGVFSSALPAKQTVEKVFVTDFDPNARAAVEFDKDGNVKKALVIPLIKTNAWKGEAPGDGSGESANSSSSGGDGASDGAGKSTQQASSKGDEPMLTVDDLAAKELLADAKSLVEGGAKSGSSSHAADLVIPMNGRLQDEGDDTNGAGTNDSKTSKRESEEDEKTKEIKKKLFNFESQEKNRKTQQQQGSDAPPTAPILRQNVVPGMDALEDMNEKYRLDVSMRPDELDVHSAAYDMVPIEDFGAALLRGMGWKGNVDKDDKGAEPKPRHKLLGLGATIRPPIPGESKNKHRKKSSQQQPPAQSRGTNEGDSKPRHSGLNHTEASSSKEQKKKQRSSRSPSPRRSSDVSRHSGKDSKRESRDRRRSSSRDHHRSSRDDKEDRSRRRDEERHASQSSSRRRSLSREGGRGRDRSSDRNSKRRSDRRRGDDRRKRSRSRERSSRR